MRSRDFIVSPAYDAGFFLLPPALALGLGIAVSDSWFASHVFSFGDDELTPLGLVITVLIHAHLAAVLVRSHGNPGIFRRHRLRFTLVPVALYLAIVSSPVLVVAASVLATFWDVYHSAMQTFGLAHIYDRNAGNDPRAARRLDAALNIMLYAGPVIAGATMLDHFEAFASFEDVGLATLAAVPGFMHTTQPWWTLVIVVGGLCFGAYYVAAMLRLRRAGHRPAPLKLYLVSSTGLCSIVTWGFNSWGEAFFIMNLFHGVQYLALVWATEQDPLTRRLRLHERRCGKLLTWLLFAGVLCGYGLWVAALDPSATAWWTITIVVSLMHFWYDGFVWSVRRSQV